MPPGSFTASPQASRTKSGYATGQTAATSSTSTPIPDKMTPAKAPIPRMSGANANSNESPPISKKSSKAMVACLSSLLPTAIVVFAVVAVRHRRNQPVNVRRMPLDRTSRLTFGLHEDSAANVAAEPSEEQSGDDTDCLSPRVSTAPSATFLSIGADVQSSAFISPLTETQESHRFRAPSPDPDTSASPVISLASAVSTRSRSRSPDRLQTSLSTNMPGSLPPSYRSQRTPTPHSWASSIPGDTQDVTASAECLPPYEPRPPTYAQ